MQNIGTPLFLSTTKDIKVSIISLDTTFNRDLDFIIFIK
jgi:hypothetical protein